MQFTLYIFYNTFENIYEKFKKCTNKNELT